jgi:hypothetical protein
MAETNESWDQYYVDYALGVDGAGVAGTRVAPWKTVKVAMESRLGAGGSHDHNGVAAILNVRNASQQYGDQAPGTNISLGSSASTTQAQGGTLSQPWVVRTDPQDFPNAAQDSANQAWINVHLTINSTMNFVRFERLRFGGPNVTAFDNPQGAGCNFIHLKYCSFHHMVQNGPQWISNGLRFPSNCGTWSCSIHDGGNDTTGPAHDHGIYVGSGSIPGAADCFSVNDVIHDMTGSGIQMYEKATRMLIANTTIVHTCYPSAVDPRWGIIVAGDGATNFSNDCLIINTLITNIAANGSTAYGIGLDSLVGATIPNHAHHNGFFANAVNMDTVAGDGYPAGMIYDGNDVLADPQFVNAAAFNYRLLPGSPMIGKASSAYLPSTDFDGKTRITADIGAFAADDPGIPSRRIPLFAGRRGS